MGVLARGLWQVSAKSDICMRVLSARSTLFADLA